MNEADAWYGIPEFNVLEQNLTIPGFSPLFPDAHCTKDGSICQLVTGEGEINAASTISALVHSDAFDLTHTHFLIARIAGISPKLATIGSVTLKGHEYKHHDVAAGELIDLEGGREDLAFVDPRVHRVEAHDHRYKLLR